MMSVVVPRTTGDMKHGHLICQCGIDHGPYAGPNTVRTPDRTPSACPGTGDSMTDDQTAPGLPDPDWHLMDPVTGEDIKAFERLSAAVAARDFAEATLNSELNVQ